MFKDNRCTEKSIKIYTTPFYTFVAIVIRYKYSKLKKKINTIATVDTFVNGNLMLKIN